jgi:hypothetical protein
MDMGSIGAFYLTDTVVEKYRIIWYIKPDPYSPTRRILSVWNRVL